ncbi:MAG: hypothetical protein LQ340_001842 [Diploschistes diacapsis]|nr:MAG: hypothetical protein LQ340_001842 [Diploschistes diacapsis]
MDPDLSRFVRSLQKCIGSENIALEAKFEGLGRQRNGNHILQNVSGNVGPGSIPAVMGASGTAKSTFVRVLMGKEKSAEDVVTPELTVRENPAALSQDTVTVQMDRLWICEHVDILSDCLKLTHIKDNLVTLLTLVYLAVRESV